MADAVTSTIPPPAPARWRHVDRALRWVLYGLIGGALVLAAAGRLGLSTSTARTQSGAVRLEVDHATVTRPGLASPFTVTVTDGGGRPLPPEVEVIVPRSYLDLFDENGLDPAPVTSFSNGVSEVWTFETDGLSTLSVDFDARIQPNQRGRVDAEIVVRVDDEVLTTSISTTVLP
jgi:hypothetical protein